jgi:hypothetical protein
MFASSALYAPGMLMVGPHEDDEEEVEPETLSWAQPM